MAAAKTKSKAVQQSKQMIDRRASEQDSRTSKPLADWRDLDAYVLLGDPGAGKTTSLEAEANACQGRLVSARSIVANVADLASSEQVVFIDALDEVRAGSADGRVTFNAIRAWLKQSGRPRFRLSCREADWLGATDKGALEEVAPGGHITVLHLESLSDAEVLNVLRSRHDEVPDPNQFLREAEKNSLTEMLRNPLLLDLTIKAVAPPSDWPNTRKDIYEQACRLLATEQNEEHLAARPPQAQDIEELLNDAGLLCAVLLLSNKQSWTKKASAAHDIVELLPRGTLPVSDAHAALATKVFTTVAGVATPRHRSIAEFLAARALAKRVDGGLPFGRLLALMQGFDGKPVLPLRGLFAWLAVHLPTQRSRLISLDPLGVVLNGDVASFATDERLTLLNALSEAARADKWFRESAWVSHPLGPLATAQMAPTYKKLLLDSARDDAHQAFMGCALDALCHGEAMPTLAAALEAWVEDRTALFGNQLRAYDAWKHNVPPKHQPAKQLGWLTHFAKNASNKDEDQLLNELLTDLHPKHLGPREVLKFLQPSRVNSLRHVYPGFWHRELLANSREEDFATLADAWTATIPNASETNGGYHTASIAGDVLAAALFHSGDEVTDDRLYRWLDIGMDRHGSSLLKDESQRKVASWLEAHPDRMKHVVEMGYQSTPRNAHGNRFFWEAEQRLHGARLPVDWLRWLLQLAATTNDWEITKYCFQKVAHTSIDPPAGFDVPSLEQIEKWVVDHTGQWPELQTWFDEIRSSPLNDGRGELHRRNRKTKAEDLHRREVHQRSLQPALQQLLKGEAAPERLLHDIAQAHGAQFADVRGDTAFDRVQTYLGSDMATAQAAITNTVKVLSRADLPSIADIFDWGLKGHYHLTRPAALLAASLSFEQSPETLSSWSDELTQKLVAFYLTEGTGKNSAWFDRLCVLKPKLLAAVLMQFITHQASGRKRTGLGAYFVSGLWMLGKPEERKELTRLVLPKLLEQFPLRSNEDGRRVLNRQLLSALNVLEPSKAKQILRAKLVQPNVDPMQRISWLVAQLPYRAVAAKDLVEWVGKNERRSIAMDMALEQQGILRHVAAGLPPVATRLLIEVLAPIASQEPRTDSDPIVGSLYLGANLRSLLALLSSDPSQQAHDELMRLADFPRLGRWKDAVLHSIRTQQSVAREAKFKAAEPAEVAGVLSNKLPANSADLRALVVWHLKDIEKNLHGANNASTRQFWHWEMKNKHRLPKSPFDENECRDVLQRELEARLKPLNIHVEREPSSAADTRADMRVKLPDLGHRIALPIEVKKEDHRKLWTAWRDQLQRKYTTDPAANGFGLYLVLWFGHSPKQAPEGGSTRRASDGTKPICATHLQDLLVERIPLEHRHQIAVHVMDLSWPT
jgi:hypothetical protein